ncbi:molybdenum ABC transporter ATP-binding protein [Celeribacter sp.]|uniref:molybdenum ABC transporter ATP-binding protein n=1 Tax=Celeribacter sp. TaxID=1890673 RepID=UPI003A926C67
MTLSVRLKHQFDAFELDVAFEAPRGITVLFGRSGAGKSTIVRAVAGLERAREAEVVLSGKTLEDTSRGIRLPAHKRNIGYIFQDARLFPHMSVRQNLEYGARLRRGDGDASELSRVVEMLGIGALLARRPAGLSGGERQRVAIGRALLCRPALLLADEPLAALDEARKAEIMPYFERLRDEIDIPVLYVTHAPAEVARLADWVVALDNGRVARAGAARDVLSDPAVLPTGVRGAGAVIEARVARHDADGLSALDAGGVELCVPHIDREIGARVRVRIAAQDVMLSRAKPDGLSALNILPATVRERRDGAGPGAMIALETPAGAVLARITRRSADAMEICSGQSIYAVVKTVSIAPEDAGS